MIAQEYLNFNKHWVTLSGNNLDGSNEFDSPRSTNNATKIVFIM